MLKRINNSKTAKLDYKTVSKLNTYVSENFTILPGSVKNNSRKLQKNVTRSIKQARFLALMPYCDQHF